MADEHFPNAPDITRDFADADRLELPELQHDAARWEPDRDDHEEPSAKHFTREYTPGGTLEQEVHAELDDQARTRILHAQRERHGLHDLADERELNFADDFRQARGDTAPSRNDDERAFDEEFGPPRRFRDRGHDHGRAR
jgi:hypothetical protein